MRLAFVVLGEPVPKGRPRFSRRGGFVRAITPDKTREYEADVALHAAMHAIGQRWPRAFDGLCEVRLTIVCSRPGNRMRKKDPDGRMWRESGRGDADNYAKAILDPMQSAGVYRNDSQVVRLVVDLLWTAKDEAPCVEIECLTLLDAAGCATEHVLPPETIPSSVASNPSKSKGAA
jgi:Holliday junction resolvase RusA-like endonuclease